METVSKISRVWLLVLFIITPFLYAQNHDSSSSYFVTTRDGFQYFQIITFPEVPDVIRYEVEIERIDGIMPVPAEKIITTVNMIEVSLRAGFYRYRFTAINRMNVIEGRSLWEEFRILPGVMPDPVAYQPFYGLYYEMSDPNGILIVHGEDLSDKAEFALVRRNDNINWGEVNLQGRSDVIVPNLVVSGDKMVSLSFARDSLKQGTYQILVLNPGGLWKVFGEVHVGYKNNNEFFIFSGYSPMIAAFDIDNAYVYHNLPGTQEPVQQLDLLNLRGFNISLGWIPIKTAIGNFGFELQLNLLADNYTEYRLDLRGNGYDNVFYMETNIVFNLLYQLPLAERWQHNIRLGVGKSANYHYFDNNQGYYSDSLMLNLGYSAQFFVWKNLYLEAGLDVQYNFSIEKDYPFGHLMFRPKIGLGWQFGRWADYQDVTEGLAKGNDYSVPVTQIPKSEFLFSINWYPMLLLSGFDLYRYYNGDPYEQVLQVFNPLGFSIRYANYFYRWDNNKLGLRFEFSILEHMNRVTDPDIVNEFQQTLDLLSHLFIGVAYQRVLYNNWHMNIHVGIGASNPYNYDDSFDVVSLAWNFGISAQLFFMNDTYVETGVDFVFILGDDFRIALRPGIAIGYQFRRNNETGLRFNQNAGEIFITQTEEQPSAQREEGSAGIQLLQSRNSNTFNTFGVSVGTSFADPVLIASLSVTFTLFWNIFADVGFDLGFMSMYDDVERYFSIYPFANLGYFVPFRGEAGGFFAGAGFGYMLGNYRFDFGSTNVSTTALNIFAGINLGNIINFTYTLRTNFESFGHKIAIGYVVRLE